MKTLSEILNQPSVWETCLKSVTGTDLETLFGAHDPRQESWLFVGCGTSYYLAQAAAASFTELLDAPAAAVPASEIMLQPQLVFAGGRPCFPVLISRSGHTSEVLQVAEILRARGVEFLAVTCDGRELESTTPFVLKLPVQEESTVMTSSFTSMLLGLQCVAARIAGNQGFIDELHLLPAHLERLLKQYEQSVEVFAQNHIEDFAVLGQGALYAIASEVALKLMESSSTYAQYFHTLEFRHGPKSIVGPDTLVCALLSERNLNVEMPVLLEMKQLGSRIAAVVNHAPDALRAQADLLVELSLPVSELASLVVYVVWGQLLGSYRGLEKGLDPDNPRNLSRVVTI
ncbi:MAG: SIS domain-containing protein [Acidobacteriaceae bacterium]|nr:SIS domain-containing protein [Acidobacteriaceae bacterium]